MPSQKYPAQISLIEIADTTKKAPKVLNSCGNPLFSRHSEPFVSLNYLIGIIDPFALQLHQQSFLVSFRFLRLFQNAQSS